MRYTITPYAYRKIREIIKTSQNCIKKTDQMLGNDRTLSRVLKEPDRIIIKLTIIK